MSKINDLPLLSNPTEDMYCLVGKDDLKKVPWSAIMGQIGSPYIATTAAGMTDKTRVYVYQGSESGYTSGNWYYWNGSAWTSGGTYNSVAVDTDKTLTQSDKPADSAVVGKKIGSLKENMDEKLIHIKSKNLINVTKAVKGYRENYNAQIVKNDAYAYIRVDVDPNTTYTVSESIARNVFIYQLSSGKGVLPAYSIGYPDKSVTFTTGEKTDQISFNFEIPAIDSIQMEKGTSATDYEAFFDFYRSKDIDYLSKK